jgi:uncharacterized membrane protein
MGAEAGSFLSNSPAAEMRLGRGASRAISASTDRYSGVEANGGLCCALAADKPKTAIISAIAVALTLHMQVPPNQMRSKPELQVG